MKRAAILLTLAVLLSLVTTVAACSQAAPSTPQRSSESAPAGAPRAPAPQDSGGSGQSQVTGDRMVIQTALLRMVVTNVDEVLSRAASLAKEMGGYVASSESQDQYGERVGKASLRVPSTKLDEALKRLKEMATRVDRESATSKDVTEEYVDQDARLRTLRATEEQYLELMRSARSTDDIIKIQQSLQQVRQQIEQTQGRMQYLQRSTEMAVINLELSTAGASRPITNSGWNAADVLSDAMQALVGLLLVIAGLAIWVVVFIPMWVPLLLLVRWYRRRERQQGASRLPPAAPGTA